MDTKKVNNDVLVDTGLILLGKRLKKEFQQLPVQE